MNSAQETTSVTAPQWVLLRPVDAWFFREGRPSNRGEDQSDVHSIFPPHNHTVVGAIRAALARTMGWAGSGDWPQEIKQKLGDGFDDLGDLSFTGLFLAIDGQPLFPMPQHVLGKMHRGESGHHGKTKCDGQLFPIDCWFEPSGWLQPDDPVLSDLGELRLPVGPAPKNGEKPLAPAEGVYIDTEGMQRILDGQLPKPNQCVHQDALFQFESRVGIRRDPESRTTGDGDIYSPRYVRLHHRVSLIVGVSGVEVSGQLPSLFPLGGESRLAACEKLTEPPKFPQSVEGGVVLMLATPANSCSTKSEQAKWYGAGPGDSAEKLSSKLSGNVVTVAMDRPLKIGGFDSRKDKSDRTAGPLPLTPYVRPGTVWWLEPQAAKLSSGLKIGQRNQHGYGHAFVGKEPDASDA